jgi:hypothetical protein
MNTENLHVALQQSFSPDINQRGPAEKLIKELKHVQGAPSMLLQIASEKQVITELFIFDFDFPDMISNVVSCCGNKSCMEADDIFYPIIYIIRLTPM